MKYIIFDLEFNSTKNAKTNKFINEIIEIGAVKLDENFNEIDCFSEVVKPTVSTKLNKYVKSLTHIQESELVNAKSFKEVINSFKKWCGKKDDNIFLTWSNTDLHVLVDNYSQLLNKSNIDFITSYSDLQKYLTRFIKTENNNQISLSDAAENFSLDTSSFSMHRALDDSRVCAILLEKTFNSNIFSVYVNNVTKGDFYKRLMFKPYFITEIENNDIDKDEFKLRCPECRNNCEIISKLRVHNKAFNGIYRCSECNKKYILNVRFKKTFDDVIVNRSIREYVKKKKAAEA